MKALGTITLVLLLGVVGFAQSSELIEKAKAGDVNSQLQLAHDYQYGVNGPRDIPRALEWLRKAATLGSTEALFRLGMLAYNGDALGDRVTENRPTAWACFEVAAVLGNAEAGRERDRVGQELTPAQMEAARLLAVTFFIQGKMAPKSVANARTELAASVNPKSPGAEVLLGMTYLDPTLEEPNPDKAIEYCQHAKKQATGSASYCLGKAYDLKGEQKLAFKNFEKAAEYGMGSAMLEVAKRYHEGRGTKANDIMAAAWAMSAASFEDAPELYRTLTAKFTPKQIKEVEKRSAQLGGGYRGLRYSTSK